MLYHMNNTFRNTVSQIYVDAPLTVTTEKENACSPWTPCSMTSWMPYLQVSLYIPLHVLN